MREVLAAHRPIGILSVGDKGLARRRGKPSLPSRGGQLSAKDMHVFSGRDHAPHQHLGLPGPQWWFRLTAWRDLLVGNTKPLDFPRDFPHLLPIDKDLRNLWTRIFLRNRTPHAQQASHLVLTPKTGPPRPLRLFFGRLAVSNLESPAVHLHARDLGNLFPGTVLLLRQGELCPRLGFRVALVRALLADPLGGPHDPLVGNLQLRLFRQVFAGLLETAGMTPRIDHLAEHGRTGRVIGTDSQSLGVREKKPCGIACIVRDDSCQTASPRLAWSSRPAISSRGMGSPQPPHLPAG